MVFLYLPAGVAINHRQALLRQTNGKNFKLCRNADSADEHLKLIYAGRRLLINLQCNVESALLLLAFDIHCRIARLFEGVANIEKYHEARYNALIENIKTNNVFSKNDQTVWECRECGHIHIGKEAPKGCPICGKKQSFFQVYAENFK